LVESALRAAPETPMIPHPTRRTGLASLAAAAQQAVDDMFTTVQDLPNDATAADAVEALQSQRQVLDDAVDNLGEGTSCE